MSIHKTTKAQAAAAETVGSGTVGAVTTDFNGTGYGCLRPGAAQRGRFAGGGHASPQDLGERRHTVARQVRCGGGYVVRGDTDDDVLSTVRDHLRTDHPELVDKVSDEQILGWIEIVA